MNKNRLYETINKFHRLSGTTPRDMLNESINNDLRAMNILNRAGIENGDEMLNKFKGFDQSPNGHYVIAMAWFYVSQGESINLNQMQEAFQLYHELLEMQRIDQIQVGNQGVSVMGKLFTSFKAFFWALKYVDNKYGNDVEVEGTEEIVFENDNVKVFFAPDKATCIKYSQKGITDKEYSFCIGQPLNVEYNGYRKEGGTFYFILDKTRDVETDPLHMVVWNEHENGTTLTDVDNNNDGEIAEFGEDVDGYAYYLKRLGVPLDIFQTNPISDEEIEDLERFETKNEDLKWFMGLSFKQKSEYITQGHLLTTDQLKYLLDKY